MTIKFSDVPQKIRSEYLWDWRERGGGVETPRDPWGFALELEGKDVIRDTLDRESRVFLNELTNGTFEYAGFTLDR